jgi:hypothetical protein
MNCKRTFWPDTGDDKYQNAKCDRFKYDSANEPLTRFYISDRSESKASLRWRFTEGATGALNFLLTPEDPDGRNTRWRFKIMIECWGNAAVLGVNLFSGKAPAATDIPLCTNVDQLVLKNDPDQGRGTEVWTGAPGLYVVGMNQTLLGPPTFEVIESIGEKILNASSMLILLIWKGTPNRVSLYTGGDAEYVEENKLVTWLGGKTIDVIKLGHHGSRIGTSTQFVEAVKPKYFVVSAGRMNGHPGKSGQLNYILHAQD